MPSNLYYTSFVPLGLTTLVLLAMPEGVARKIVVALSILVWIKIYSPTNLTKLVVKFLEDTERLYHGIVQDGLFTVLTSATHCFNIIDVEDSLHQFVTLFTFFSLMLMMLCFRLQAEISELQVATIHASWKPWKQICMLFNGHCICMLRCTFAIVTLKRKIEVSG